MSLKVYRAFFAWCFSWCIIFALYCSDAIVSQVLDELGLSMTDDLLGKLCFTPQFYTVFVLCLLSCLFSFHFFFLNNDIVWCSVERCEHTHRSVGNLSFCQMHAFEVSTPTATYPNLSSLSSFYQFSLSNVIPSKNLSSNIISCHFIYSANGFFNCWSFIFLPFCREQAKRAHNNVMI